MRTPYSCRLRSVSILVLFLVLLVFAGCGGSDEGTRTAPAELRRSNAASARDGGGRLLVGLSQVTSSPKAGSPVRFRLSIATLKAHGPPAYIVRFGDGRAIKRHPSQGCEGSGGLLDRRSQRLSHSYRKPGVYRVRATIEVDCDEYRATAALLVRVVE